MHLTFLMRLFVVVFLIALSACDGGKRSGVDCVDADNDGAGVGSDCRLVDCNDSDAAINATAAEIPADGIDQNCDGKELCFADGDGDGVGGNTLVLDVDADLSCATGRGVAAVSGDCDDAASTCTTDCATDTDGDGYVDCRDLCLDVDGDDHGTAGGGAGCVTDGGSGGNTSCELDAACIADDCDDAAGTCTTDCSTDADSDGFVDCRDLCVDADGDGYGAAAGAGCVTNGASGGNISCELGASCNDTDCDDAASTCTTDCATDTDGDGYVDCRDLCVDADGDDHGTAGGGAGCVTDGGSGGNTSCELDATCIAADCNDTASTCTTDCSTDADGDTYVDCRDLCLDADGDDHGTAGGGAGCVTDGGSGGNFSCELDGACIGSDCDDTDELTFPGATETVADGIDQDCNGNDRCYADIDGDGAGQATEIDERDGDLDCTNDLGVTNNNSDCNDLDPMSHPGALEIPDDGIDQDCGSDGDVSASDSLGVFVDSSFAGCSSGTGTMANPVCSIGEGISAARNAGLRLVFIASGTYNESVSIDGQSLMGGYKTSTWLRNIDAYPTTIASTASTASAAVSIQDSSLEALEVLDGLTISGGSGTGNQAAVQSSGSDWRIHRCTIDGGTSSDAETVGISASNGNGILSQSIVSGGKAATIAHGMTVATSSLVVWRSAIDGGTAGSRAGALTAAGSTLHAIANTLSGPTEADEAWALATDSGTVLLVSNVIWGGSGTNAIGVANSGAGVLLLHNTILAGSSDTNASAVLLAGGNTTLLGNILEASGATGSYGIIAQDGTGELHDNQVNGATCLVYGPACLATTTEVDNCTFPGCTSASGTRTGEPGFVEAGLGDYHLSATSTLIDTLTWPATSYPLLADYDLDHRPSDAGGGALWDIGADERADRPADHLVISEVGADFAKVDSCDYVELYNPTASPISLAGMSVQRGTGAPGGLTVVTLDPDTVAAHSFYLVADATWNAEARCLPAADYLHSGLYINNDDVVMLVSDTEAVVNCHDSDIIDRVGFGNNACAEGRSPTENPTNVSAIFRKADALSTAASMKSGGSDELRGHSEDRDDNGRDFVRIKSFQDPQNSSAAPQMP